jgi:hypothetical protein
VTIGGTAHEGKLDELLLKHGDTLLATGGEVSRGVIFTSSTVTYPVYRSTAAAAPSAVPAPAAPVPAVAPAPPPPPQQLSAEVAPVCDTIARSLRAHLAARGELGIAPRAFEGKVEWPVLLAATQALPPDVARDVCRWLPLPESGRILLVLRHARSQLVLEATSEQVRYADSVPLFDVDNGFAPCGRGAPPVPAEMVAAWRAWRKRLEETGGESWDEPIFSA